MSLVLLPWLGLALLVVFAYLYRRQYLVATYRARKLSFDSTVVVSSNTPNDTQVVVPQGKQVALVFINTKAGGQLGSDLLKAFSRRLHHLQIVNLAETAPEKALLRYASNAPESIRVLVCGGDGTVGWILSACRACQVTFPVAIMPLGTGNDLARSLRWGSGVKKADIRIATHYLADLARSTVRYVDQWSVCIDGIGSGAEGATKELVMNNYFSLGVDADAALKFHRERERHPDRFTSQGANVLKYALCGFETAFDGVPMDDGVTLEVVDDSESSGSDTAAHSVLSSSSQLRRIELNPHWKGLVVSNIPFYQGGKRFWVEERKGTKCSSAESAAPQQATTRCGAAMRSCSMGDKLLEVMALSGTFHIGMIQIALDSAIALAQSPGIRLTLREDTAMQVDGEPWMQKGPCTVTVRHMGQYPLLVSRAAAP